MEISTPTPEDIPALLELWKKQYEYHHDLDDVYYVPYSEQLKNTFEKYLVIAMNDHAPHILVAKEGGKLEGFITFTADEETYFDTQIKKFGLVIELYVSDESRGHGVGKSLMNAVEEFFRSNGLTNIKLSCSTFNKNTLNFYNHLGYTNRQAILFKKL